MTGKKIEALCVAGAGAMGRQIALNGAVKGFQVRLYDSSKNALDSAEAWCNTYLDGSVERGKLEREEAENVKGRVRFMEQLSEALENADLVIEAIIEKEEVKKELLMQIDKYVSEDTIIASNSSYIPSSVFKDAVRNPGRLCNLHYFNPAMRMDLVEIVRGEHTSDETIERLTAFAEKIHKKYIVVQKEIEGFVVNRLLKALQDEAYFLVDEGIATVEEVDLGAEIGLNHPMGPFRLMDLTGLDINYYNRQRRYQQTKAPKDKPPACLEEKFKKGEFGRKSGRGWYQYQ